MKRIFTILFLVLYFFNSNAQTVMPLPAYGSTYTGSVRGFWFTAPQTFYITGLRVPTDVGTGSQAIQLMRFPTIPPTYATTTNTFTNLFYTPAVPGTGFIPVNITINSGDIIGILGCRDNGSGSPSCSYSVATTFTSDIGGMPVAIARLGWQGSILISPGTDIWTEASTISRVEIQYQLTNPAGGGGPNIPPIAGYVYNILTDTVWLNSPNIFTNISNNSLHAYWDVTGYCPTANGTYTPYAAVRKCTPQWPGMCYIDTTSTNFRWTFQNRGYYKVKLKVVNNYGADSIEKKIYVDTPSVKPIASFFSDRRTVGFTDQLNYFDLSLNGPTQWSWWLNPGYIGASTFAGAGLPNSWSPGSTVQNPQLNALDGGNFDVCLMVSNLRGSDTLCKHNYLTVNNG
ncbi:MAG: hypothetical protein WCO54_11075, partial [Bacteroidota bacterium]